MPDQIPSYEQAIESDLRQLAAEIQRNREHPEFQGAAERALIKESIRSFPQTDGANQSAASSAVPVPSRGPLPAYADAASPEVKLEIEYLLDMALHQGISKAVTESKKSPDFVQDAFHDSLAGKLYPELQKRGMVK